MGCGISRQWVVLYYQIKEVWSTHVWWDCVYRSQILVLQMFVIQLQYQDLSRLDTLKGWKQRIIDITVFIKYLNINISNSMDMWIQPLVFFKYVFNSEFFLNSLIAEIFFLVLPRSRRQVFTLCIKISLASPEITGICIPESWWHRCALSLIRMEKMLYFWRRL